jgi:hypothetical protein
MRRKREQQGKERGRREGTSKGRGSSKGSRGSEEAQFFSNPCQSSEGTLQHFRSWIFFSSKEYVWKLRERN